MAAPPMNLFGGFDNHLGSSGEELQLGPGGGDTQGLIFAGTEFGLHGLSQEQKDLFRQYSQHVEQEREVQARLQHAFDSCVPNTNGAQPHTSLLGQAPSMTPSPQPQQQQSASQTGFAHPAVSVPHTPLKPFDSALVGMGASALSTPTISTGSLSLAGTVMNPPAVEAPSSALHSGSPMTPRQMLASADNMLLMPSNSLLSVHTTAPGQSGQAVPPPPPPPPPSTPNHLLGMSGAGNGIGGAPSGSAGGGGGGSSGQGQLTMAFANALAQAAAERGVDPATLVQLLQSPKLVDVLLSKAGDLQQQQSQQPQQQQMGQLPMQPPPPPPPPPPPKPSQLQSRMSAPAPGEWPPHPAAMGTSPGSLTHFRPPPPPPPPRPSPAAAAAATSFGVGPPPPPPPPPGSSGGGAGIGAGAVGGSSASGSSTSGGGSMENVPQMQQVLSSHLVQEFVSARGVLVQLMLSAYAFLNSDSMRDFYAKLGRVSMLYDEMHDLPVVQKRKRCLEMSYLRMELMQDPSFTQILQAVCALRHHLHSLSRKVLVMNQGPDGIPIDLLLGSMSTELFHVMKTVLPQEVCDFFGNCLPHPRLAVLVFAEFTSVDPMPTLT